MVGFDVFLYPTRNTFWMYELCSRSSLIKKAMRLT